jgi:beta-fructofuranosidase
MKSALAAAAVFPRQGRLGAVPGGPREPSPSRLAADPQRPQYHFLSKANWVNDPNGPIFWKGYYHLFYQYSSTVYPQGPKLWGHARSKDMVYWEHLPMALVPTPGGPDKDGCWSGSAFNNRGVPTVVYTGVFPQVQCLATSDDELTLWKKSSANPVVGSPPAALAVTGFRDPSIWREGNAWLMSIGSGLKGRGGMVLLYGSDDLAHWDYRHPLFSAPQIESARSADPKRYDAVASGDMWECPDFFPLGEKHVLLVSTQGRVHYFVGTYTDQKFHSERHGLIDASELHYASKTFADREGRRILWGWVRESRSNTAQNAAGWSGAISLPRVLSIDAGGSLRMEPLPELDRLHGQPERVAELDVSGFQPVHTQGDSLELRLSIEPQDANECGLSVRRSPHAEEETVISYDAAAQQVVLATGRSSLSSDAGGASYRCPLKLNSGERLRFAVFLDASVVEVFVNDRVCLTGRTYATRLDAVGVGAFARDGRARVHSLETFPMKPISRDRLTS